MRFIIRERERERERVELDVLTTQVESDSLEIDKRRFIFHKSIKHLK